MNQYNDLYNPNVVVTYSGKLFNIATPVPEQVFAIDIAVGLARECRFGGGTKKFYSVAEHSVWMARRAEESWSHLPHLPFKCLLHDAHEAYLKDVPTPVKQHFTAAYNALAYPIQDVIHKRLGITVSEEEKRAIAQLDQDAVEWEWDNKVKSWSGLCLPTDQSRADYWLQYFKQWCRVPHCVSPNESKIS